MRAASPRQQRAAFKGINAAAHVEDLTPSNVQVVPLAERSNWARRIANGEFVTTVEVLPPKGCDAAATLDSIRLLKAKGVNAVNIPDGPRAQTRMSAQATALLVEREIGLETDHVRAPFVEARSEDFRRGAEDGVAVGLDRDLRDDRQVAQLAHGADRFA